MNIQQFQYVLAVVNSKNFEDAAETCCVTQSTLSTMINKFESEIGIRIFNRKTKPVTITVEGQQIIDRLKIITNEIDLLGNVIQEIKGEMVGDLKIGVIPTIAPYLLPLFIHDFAKYFPKVNITVKEMTTEQIEKELIFRNIDVGILALPLFNKELEETPIYNEPFFVYDCTGDKHDRGLSPDELDFSKICLLEEGHCLRTQIYSICELSSKKKQEQANLKLESGSIESLIRITEARKGLTILPHLAIHSLHENALESIVNFRKPIPARSIGLVTHKFFVKKSLKKSLVESIQHSVNDFIPDVGSLDFINPV
ncbi:MAG: LysR family transcriptional regulator [Cytophagales bacterium]|nr:LysR family transcriptional regulator [Cytophagales bacterium]